MRVIWMQYGFSIIMEIIYDHLLRRFCNSLLHWQDLFAGYEVDCLLKNTHLYFSLKLHLMTIGSF